MLLQFGAVSWTAREDAAEAASRILLSNGAYDGPTTQTARDALTFTEIARIASEVTGREIRTRILNEEEWVAAQLASGQPEFVARFMLGMYQAAAGDFFAGANPLLRELLEREPHTVRELLQSPMPNH
jgi:NAD(P)H dehydrogenase (quinone)